MKPAVRFVMGAVIFYAALCAALFLAQRQFIYFPDRLFPEIAGAGDAGFICVRTQDDLTLIGWYAPARAGKKTILYLHGNAGNIGHRFPMVNTYIERGYGVLLAEYRGYGGNPGRPDEAGFYEDARAYLSYLLDERGVPLSQIVLYGESIGSGPAMQMALEYPDAAGVMLVTPFTSLADIARLTYFFTPVDVLLRDRFDNVSKAGSVRMPQYYFAAGRDEIVPPELTRALYEAAAEPKYWYEYADATHMSIHKKPLINDVLDILAGM